MMTRSSSGLLKHIAGAVLIAFCGAGLAFAQKAAAPTTTAAVPAYNLDADVQRVLKTFDVPGIAIAVVKDGKVVVTQGFGVRASWATRRRSTARRCSRSRRTPRPLLPPAWQCWSTRAS